MGRSNTAPLGYEGRHRSHLPHHQLDVVGPQLAQQVFIPTQFSVGMVIDFQAAFRFGRHFWATSSPNRWPTEPFPEESPPTRVTWGRSA